MGSMILTLTLHKPGLSGFTTGAEVARERRAVFRISTGSKSLDTALGGSECLLALTQS